jgi:hypothetical protein
LFSTLFVEPERDTPGISAPICAIPTTKQSEEIDICAVRVGEQGLFLLSTLDIQPRQRIVRGNGDYELRYKVFAREIPWLDFAVKVHLQWPAFWQHESEVTIINDGGLSGISASF